MITWEPSVRLSIVLCNNTEAIVIFKRLPSARERFGGHHPNQLSPNLEAEKRKFLELVNEHGVARSIAVLVCMSCKLQDSLLR